MENNERPLSQLYYATWPSAGMMRNGIPSPQQSSARHTSEKECSLWRTPQAQDTKSGDTQRGHTQNLTHQAQRWPTPPEAIFLLSPPNFPFACCK